MRKNADISEDNWVGTCSHKEFWPLDYKDLAYRFCRNGPTITQQSVHTFMVNEWKLFLMSADSWKQMQSKMQYSFRRG